MNNCLVTKLKEEVQNDNLPRFGEFKFNVDVKEGITATFAFKSTKQFTATIEGEGHFYKGTPSSQTDVTTTISNVLSTGSYKISAGVSVIRITPKYNLTDITLVSGSENPFNRISIDFEQLYYNEPGFSKIQLRSSDNADFAVEIDFDKIKLNNLTELQVGSSKQKGHIVNIAKAAGNGDLLIGSYKVKTQLTGSIEEYVRNVSPAHYGHTDGISANDIITLHDSAIVTSLAVVFDSEGNATITRPSDSTVLATYNRSNDTFTYNL